MKKDYFTVEYAPDFSYCILYCICEILDFMKGRQYNKPEQHFSQ